MTARELAAVAREIGVALVAVATAALLVAPLRAQGPSAAGRVAGRPAVQSAVRVTPLLVATRPLPRGYTLAAGDMAAAPAEPGTTTVAAAPEALVGWTTRRVIAAGEVLRAPAVSPPAAVRAGQAVTLLYQADGVTLRLNGTAAADAPVGARVAVRVDMRRRLEGVVAGPNVVRLP